MRYLPLLILVLVLGGCVRQNYLDTPDRKGHAWQLGAKSQAAGAKSMAYRMPPQPGERVVVLQPGQKLWQIAETYQVDLYALIERNDFTTNPYPSAGTQVIVPDMPVSR